MTIFMSRYRPKYFSIEELTRSTTATRRGIKNEPGLKEISNMYDLIENTLDPIREKWGKAITVSSGYRCKRLNELVGGASASSHLTGQAADITVGGKDENRRLYDMIKSSGIPFTKLIYETNKNGAYWVHISFIKQNVLKRSYIYDLTRKSYIPDPL